MSPPLPYRDLWLAAALGSSTLSTAVVHANQNPAPIGIITAIAQTAEARPGNADQMVIGSGVAAGQRLQTNSDGPLHILFLDQSAITLSSDSELVIQEFSYDEATRTGKIQVELTRGSLRIVGGYISKNTPAIINTPHAKVEVSGGISTVQTTPQNTSASFLFGQQMRVSNSQGTETVTRPGFGISSSGNAPSSPLHITVADGLLSKPHSNTTTSASPQTTSIQSGSPLTNSLVSLSDSKSPLSSSGQPNAIAQDRVNSNITNTLNTNPSQTLNNVLRTNSTTISS